MQEKQAAIGHIVSMWAELRIGHLNLTGRSFPAACFFPVALFVGALS